MIEALKEARKAFEEGEVPVGAVVVKDGEIIGRGHNRTEALKDPTAHAEIIALSAAANRIGNWRLKGATLYVTLEPCLMCAGASILARIDKIVYGADDPKFGALGSVMDIREGKWNHSFEVEKGVLKEEAAKLMKEFFKRRRDGRVDEGARLEIV